MKDAELIIRMANISDAEALLKIYEPYVKNTAITFEYEVPTVDEFAQRINRTLTEYPYLVAVIEDEIVGYAYAGRFKVRKAYDWAVETSIYIRQDMKREGIGRLLYNSLEEILKKQNVLNLNACIAYSEEDEYLPKDSITFHECMAYKMCGRLHKCGYKNNRWYDIVWMEKLIGEHSGKQPDFIPVCEVKVEEILKELSLNGGIKEC